MNSGCVYSKPTDIISVSSKLTVTVLLTPLVANPSSHGMCSKDLPLARYLT